MPVLHTTLQGRFGNQVCQFLFCRALADRYSYDLHCDEWIGEKVFDIPPAPRHRGGQLRRHNEIDIWEEMPNGQDIEFRGYGQTTMRKMDGHLGMAQCTVYSKRQVQEWLPIKPDLLAILNRILANRTPLIRDSIVAHQRAGDYIGYGYPVVSKQSYLDTAVKYFGSCAHVTFVTEETALNHAPLPDELAFLPDFYRLTQAPVLMRGNSTFSFVAGLLGNGLVLSPRIDNLVGGVEHDGVQFEAGNHCRLANFDFCSDLHVVP